MRAPRTREAQIATAIIQDVCELPDRTSPDDQPDLLQVTVDELRLILERNLAELRAGAEPSGWVHPEQLAQLHTETDAPANERFTVMSRIQIGSRDVPLYTHAPVPREAEQAAWADVRAERERHKKAKGWTEAHDDHHHDGAIIWDEWGARSRLTSYVEGFGGREQLVKAGALILAEIERLDRAALAAKQEGKSHDQP